MVIEYEVFKLRGIKQGNKAYAFFEKRNSTDDSDGVYLMEFDLTSNSIPDPITAFDTAIRIIEKSVYTNDVDRFYLYANNDGSEVTLVTIIEKVDGIVKMYTGRVSNGSYTACDNTATDINGDLEGLFGFYFNNNQKIKLYSYNDGNHSLPGGEGH